MQQVYARTRASQGISAPTAIFPLANVAPILRLQSLGAEEGIFSDSIAVDARLAAHSRSSRSPAEVCKVWYT